MNSIIKEIRLIKSDRFLLWVAIFTLPLLSANTYYVYYDISVLAPGWKELVCAGVSIVLAGFILIYTIRKDLKTARYYSFFEMLISFYYYANTIGLQWPLLPAIGFTLILPYSLYRAAKEIDKNSLLDSDLIFNLQNEIKAQDQKIKYKEDEIEYLKKELHESKETSKLLADNLDELSKGSDFTNNDLELGYQIKKLQEELLTKANENEYLKSHLVAANDKVMELQEDNQKIVLNSAKIIDSLNADNNYLKGQMASVLNAPDEVVKLDHSVILKQETTEQLEARIQESKPNIDHLYVDSAKKKA